MWIGLSGKAGAGKDTAAARFPARYRRYSFAQPLKQALEVLGLPEPKDRALKEGLIPERGYSWRTAAQTLGTDWARKLDPDFWTNLAKQSCSNSEFVVFTDVRFENEADMIRKQGGYIIHITGRTSITTPEQAAHLSEQPLQIHASDSVIYNDKDLASFHEQVDFFIAVSEGSHGG